MVAYIKAVKALKGSFLVICTACFLGLCWRQLVNYLIGKTGVTQEWKPSNRRFPNLIFCPRDGFRG